MQEAQVSQEQETSKIIKVVETPEDLYIIGRFPQSYYDMLWRDKDLEGDKAKAVKLLNDNFHNITDDYHTLDLKGKAKPESKHGIETVGSYAILTASELKFIIDMYPMDSILDVDEEWDADFNSIYRDNYAMRIADYVGEIRIAMLDYDDQTIDYLLEYDNKDDGVLYCKMVEGDEEQRHAFPCLICESGFYVKYLQMPHIFGFKEVESKRVEIIYRNPQGDVIYGGEYDDVVIPITYKVVGSRVIKSLIWEK